MTSATRLTSLSHGAGCACKLSPDELAEIIGPLAGHPAYASPQLLVGVGTSDDAGVWKLDGGQHLVQTVDFFTPIVDDPFDWGRIAAANALSDVYAMGGRPISALQVVAWPRTGLAFSILADVLRGGADVMHASGTTIVGGHSIDDPEPKYGFAVTGLVAKPMSRSTPSTRAASSTVEPAATFPRLPEGVKTTWWLLAMSGSVSRALRRATLSFAAGLVSARSRWERGSSGSKSHSEGPGRRVRQRPEPLGAPRLRVDW